MATEVSTPLQAPFHGLSPDDLVRAYRIASRRPPGWSI